MIILVAISTLFLIVALSPKNVKKDIISSNNRPQSTQAVTPTRTPGNTQLWFELPAASISARAANSPVSVAANTGEDEVNEIDLELAFDPKAINSVQISPGTFFKHSIVKNYIIDARLGRISYDLSIDKQTSASGSGIVAFISFVQGKTASGSAFTSLSFLPSTKVISKDMKGSVLKKTRDIMIPMLRLGY